MFLKIDLEKEPREIFIQKLIEKYGVGEEKRERADNEEQNRGSRHVACRSV